MKQTKGAKTKKLSPKKGSQRITAFFRSRGSQHIDLSAQTSSSANPVSETESEYFQAHENEETIDSKASNSQSSKFKRLSLRKGGRHSSHTSGDGDSSGASSSSQNKQVADVSDKSELSTKRKSNSHVESSDCVLSKKSKHELLTDEADLYDGKHDTEDKAALSTSSVNINNESVDISTSGNIVSVTEVSSSLAASVSDLDNLDQPKSPATECKSPNTTRTSCENTDVKCNETNPSVTSSCDCDDGEFAKTTNVSVDIEEVIDKEIEEEEYRIPYYLENFVTIVNYVVNDDFYTYLFSDDDRQTVRLFQNLTENGQKLFVRLFGRQYRWIRKSKIVYAKISEDLTAILDELVDAGLIDDESKLVDLPDILKALPVPDLKTLGKSLRLNINQLREDLINAVIKHCSKSNISSFFQVKDSCKTGRTDHALVQRAKKLLGRCYRLCKNGRSVFMRITMLFGLHRTHGEEDERGAGQAQLFQMLMSNIGKVKYPEYTVNRKTKIFESRESLQSFSAGLQVEVDMVEALESKDYDTSMDCYRKAKEKLEDLRQNDATMRHDQALPAFLSVYTAGAVYTRVLSQGVELFQFKKQYTDAVQQLKELIQQETYHLDYRGRWYERLVLNLDHHLKKPSEALDYIKVGLTDPNIRAGHRYALFQRAQKICHAPSNKKLRRRWQEFSEDVMALVAEAPKVYIKGKRLEHVSLGGYAMFISEDSFNKGGDEVTFIKRVEDVALNYYREQGYTQGIHAEGGIISLLFNLVMWDIIFCDDIPDVFYNMYQTLPLDLYTEAFYLNRKTTIDRKLREISEWTEEELCSTIEALWTEHYGTLCVGINWELFTDVEHLTGLCCCMGVSVLTAVFDRMAKDRRFTRSGVPDLTVWNPQDKTFKIVEVKGPGDRLSTKQVLWLDYLINVGVKAEVCHVQAIGVKKIH